jgi:hypothetical protein
MWEAAVVEILREGPDVAQWISGKAATLALEAMITATGIAEPRNALS